MEPTMIKLKVLSTVAAIALVLPIAAPSASCAHKCKGGKGGVAVGGGRGAPAARFSGGGEPMARFSGGGAPTARYSGSSAAMARYGAVSTGGAPVARYSGTGVTRYSGGSGGGWNGGPPASPGGGFLSRPDGGSRAAGPGPVGEDRLFVRGAVSP